MIITVLSNKLQDTFVYKVFILFFIYLSTPFDFYWQLDSTAARVIKSLSFLLAFFGLYNLSNGKIKTL